MIRRSKTLTIFAARDEDAHQDWIWLQDSNLPARGIVQITNPATRHSVYCEALQIDSNFLVQYNEPPRIKITDPITALVISAWYRANLGDLETQIESTLEISSADSLWARFRACVQHPQIVVRLATWLSGIGLVLGVIGLFLGVVSLHERPGG